jgi:gliding motility-associated-like protein
LKYLNKILSLIFFLVILPGIGSYAQTIPVACGSSVVRYGVIGNNGTSVFDWTIAGGAIVNNYNDSIDVQWNDVVGAHIITVVETNIYGCEGEPYLETIMVTTPFIDLGVDVEMCQNETEEFIASSADITDYLWQDSTIGETLIASTEGVYWVRITDVSGCVASDTVAVTIHELPIVDLGSDTAICEPGAILTLDPSDNWSNSFAWFDGDDLPLSNSPTIDVTSRTEDQEFWVSVTDEFGCEGTDTIVVRLCGKLTIPNVFTPNGDGINEVWEIEELFVFEDLTIDIFNRWGERVFHSYGYSSDSFWDGNDSKGKKLPMDAYYYVIDLHNGEEPIVGNVTIVR